MDVSTHVVVVDVKPVGHGVHDASPDKLVPEVHTVHAVAPPKLYEPAEQGAQALEVSYVPAGQEVRLQSLDPATDKPPESQGAQEVAPALLL